MTTPLKTSAIGSLILVRLLAAGEKGETAAKVKKDLGSLLVHRWSGMALADRLDHTLDELEAAGLVQSLPGKTRKAAPKVALTAEGCRHGLEFLGVTTLRPKTTWAVLRKTYLPASVLGLHELGSNGAGLKTWVVRAFLPEARAAWVVDLARGEPVEPGGRRDPQPGRRRA